MCEAKSQHWSFSQHPQMLQSPNTHFQQSEHFEVLFFIHNDAQRFIHTVSSSDTNLDKHAGIQVAFTAMIHHVLIHTFKHKLSESEVQHVVWEHLANAALAFCSQGNYTAICYKCLQLWRWGGDRHTVMCNFMLHHPVHKTKHTHKSHQKWETFAVIKDIC